MSNNERVAGCVWRLFQVGLLVLALGVGLIFMVWKKGEKAKGADVESALAEQDGAGEGGQPGIFERIKQWILRSGEEGKSQEDGLKNAQEANPTGPVELETLQDLGPSVTVERAVLAEGTTNVQQTVSWQISGGQIYYRIILTPYDREAHTLMMDRHEALFISFCASGGERIVPVAAAAKLETRTLRVATADGYAAGWFLDGQLPLDGQAPERIAVARVGWIFSDRLHARLRRIQQPAGGQDGTGQDPFGIRTEVE